MTTTPRADTFRDLTVDAFIARLSSSDPVPGGGSAAAMAAALGAGLVTMVAALSTGRSRYVAHEELLGWADEAGRRLSNHFLELAQDDADAYAGFALAMKLPRESEAQIQERTTAMQSAARKAADVPMRCVEACVELVAAAEALAGRSNVNASSDLNVAALLGEAAARGAAANVLVNLPSMGDPETEGSMMVQVDQLLHEIQSLAGSVRQIVAAGQVREPFEPASPSARSNGPDDAPPAAR